MTALPYIAIIVLVIFSAFFSGSEIAFTSVNKVRLRKIAEGGSKTAKRALAISDHFDKMLSTVLIGNNLVNIAASSIATGIFLSLLPNSQELGSLLATLAMTVIILIFGEIMPKIVSKQISETVTRIAAYPLTVLLVIFYPVVILVTWIVKLLVRPGKKGEPEEPSVTEDELVSIIETAEDEDVIDEEKSDLLQSALEFSDTAVGEIITPRTEMLAIDIDDDINEIIEQATESHFSRIPVYEDSIDNIIGILYLNHFYKQLAETPDKPDIRSLLIEPCFFHKTMKLPAVLAEMRRRQMHIAIIIDEYGGTLGLVTMEDILEEIVGEIWDESDEIKNDIVKVTDDTYEASGEMNVYDFFEDIDIDDRHFDSEYTTVGGWCVEQLDGMPHVGDSFQYENIIVTVAEMDDLRVSKVMAQVLPLPDEEEE